MEKTCVVQGYPRLNILACRPKPGPQLIRWENLVCSEPLELEYLYAALHLIDEVYLLDGLNDRRDPVKVAKSKQVQVVLLTSYITNINAVLNTAARLKALANPPLVFVGGPHAEVVPEHFFSSDIDAVFFSNQLQAVATVVGSMRAQF